MPNISEGTVYLISNGAIALNNPAQTPCKNLNNIYNLRFGMNTNSPIEKAK